MALDVPLDTARILAAKPTQNSAARVEDAGAGCIVFVPITRPRWLRALGFALPLRAEKGFALDALGREVWLACDGSRTFEAIVLEFAAGHQLRFHEARVMLAQFLSMLTERRLIALVVPSEVSPG